MLQENDASFWGNLKRLFFPPTQDVSNTVSSGDVNIPQLDINKLDPQGVWFDRDGNVANFSIGNEVYPFNFDNWNKIINPKGDGDSLSDEEYWGLISRLKKHGFINRAEIPMTPPPPVSEDVYATPILIPLFNEDDKEKFKSPEYLPLLPLVEISGDRGVNY